MENNFTPGMKVQTTLYRKYQFCIVRGRPIHLQPSKSSFLDRRVAGDTNLDLWLDKTIYPMNSSTRRRPNFCDVKTLLEFVEEGMQGLLGYILGLMNPKTARESVAFD